MSSRKIIVALFFGLFYRSQAWNICWLLIGWSGPMLRSDWLTLALSLRASDHILGKLGRRLTWYRTTHLKHRSDFIHGQSEGSVQVTWSLMAQSEASVQVRTTYHKHRSDFIHGNWKLLRSLVFLVALGWILNDMVSYLRIIIFGPQILLVWVLSRRFAMYYPEANRQMEEWMEVGTDIFTWIDLFIQVQS